MIKYLAALVQSFYSPIVYRDAIVRWKGFGGQYLMVLAAAIAIIMSIGFYMTVLPLEKTALPYFVKQVPPMTIEDGVISVTEKQPVIIQSQDKKFTLMIDTRKSASELRDTKSDIAVGKDFLIARGTDDTYQSVDLGKVKGKILIDQPRIYQYIQMFKVLAMPLLWLGQLINLAIKLFIVTVLSYVVTAFMREEYDFAVRMRLSILALTPALIISLVSDLAFKHEMAPWFFMLLACLYLYVMIILMRRLPPVEISTYSEVI